MSGVAIAWYLLKTNAPVLAALGTVSGVIARDRIKADELPLKLPLPAISITLVSDDPRLTVAMTETPRLYIERVQVSWLFKSKDAIPSGTDYPGKREMDVLIRNALPNTSGTVNGFAVDSILPDSAGPDLSDDAAGIKQASRDFIIKYRL